MLAQNTLFDEFSALRITPGTIYHGSWTAGRVERNRRIYDYEFVYFSRGNGRVITGETTFRCRAGSVILIPPQCVHCTIGDTAVERWCIHFDWHGFCPARRKRERIWVFLDDAEEFDPALAAHPLPEHFGISFPFHNILPERERSTLLGLLEAFFTAPRETLPELIRVQGLFQEILALALTQGSGKETPGERRLNPRFFQAKSLIDASFPDSSLTAGGIASRLGITPNHLTRLFRKELGMSTLDYLQNLRLRHAEELLRGNAFNIQEIARECGFEDQNYFSRLFRLRRGMTPGAFRRLAQTPEE